MEFSWNFFLMSFGFLAASYSVVANDAIQTLGTFLSSNSKKPWWVLWLFATSILVAVILYGWFVHGGDVSYGRLSAKFPVPESFTWVHIIPPIVIIFLTRKGIPVSTTFLVLTVFAPSQLGKIVSKSLLGYTVAFTAALVVYYLVANWERKITDKPNKTVPTKWIAFQWLSTAFLWSQWLIQDLANIYVYMPSRSLSIGWLLYSLVILAFLHGLIFYFRGGPIQKIVTSKTGTANIKSATIIDIIFGTVLLFFKEISNIPMSTTWVFIGLLAGRELGLRIRLADQSKKSAFKLIGQDLSKAGLGLAVSVILALSLPVVSKYIDKTYPKVVIHKVLK